jgi:hypothetical protein
MSTLSGKLNPRHGMHSRLNRGSGHIPAPTESRLTKTAGRRGVNIMVAVVVGVAQKIWPKAVVILALALTFAWVATLCYGAYWLIIR